MKIRRVLALSVCSIMTLSILAGCEKKVNTSTEVIEVTDDNVIQDGTIEDITDEDFTDEDVTDDDATDNDATDENITDGRIGGGQELPATGGWSIYGSYTQLVTDEEKETFEKALTDLDGASYVPVAVIATQIVSGTNYAYLAYGTLTDANATKQWDIVVIYKDLSGNVSLTSINPINVSDVATIEEDKGQMMGAWECAALPTAATFDEAIQKAFDDATKDADEKLSPIALLGTQVVAGANYRFLCKGTDDGRDKLYVATIWVNPQGEAQLTDCDEFDITAYMN